MVIRALFLHLLLVGTAARSSDRNGRPRHLRNARKELDRHLKDSRLLQYDFKRVLVDRGSDQSRSLVGQGKGQGKGNAYGHDKEKTGSDSDSASEDSVSITSSTSSDGQGKGNAYGHDKEKTGSDSDSASEDSVSIASSASIDGVSSPSPTPLWDSASLSSVDVDSESSVDLSLSSESSGDETVGAPASASTSSSSFSSGDRRRKLERRLPGANGKGHAYGKAKGNAYAFGHDKNNAGKSSSEDDATSSPTFAPTKGGERRRKLGRRLPGANGKGHAYGKAKGKGHAYGHDKNNVGKSSSEDDATSRPTFAPTKPVSPPPGETDDWLA